MKCYPSVCTASKENSASDNTTKESHKFYLSFRIMLGQVTMLKYGRNKLVLTILYQIDGRIILRWIFRKWEEVVGDWMVLAQDRHMWRALVSTVMNIRVRKKRGIS